MHIPCSRLPNIAGLINTYALAPLTHVPQRAEGYPSRPPRTPLTVLTDIPQEGAPEPAARRELASLFVASSRGGARY